MNQPAARSRHLLACLGDPSRFRIVLSLLEGDRCVTELAAAVGLSQSCTTRHLQYLEREDIVRGDRQGKRVVFRLRSDRPRVRELLAWVTATPAAPPGKHGGADLHIERPGLARKRGPRPGARSGPAVPPGRSQPPSFARPPASDLADGSGPPESDRPVPDLQHQTEAPAAARTSEIEDWLL